MQKAVKNHLKDRYDLIKMSVSQYEKIKNCSKSVDTGETIFFNGFENSEIK